MENQMSDQQNCSDNFDKEDNLLQIVDNYTANAMVANNSFEDENDDYEDDEPYYDEDNYFNDEFVEVPTTIGGQHRRESQTDRVDHRLPACGAVQPDENEMEPYSPDDDDGHAEYEEDQARLESDDMMQLNQ